ncbi:MAG TPA: DUF6176 family protein [Allosphingosinicella sp.]|nr:DUF6176 family protein [Allosphingosinicella sp.]
MYPSRLYMVKQGMLQEVQDWMLTLSTVRREEALATFQYEDVDREIFVLFRGFGGEYYAFGFNLAGEAYRPGDPDVLINREHLAMKKACLEPISAKGEVFLDLKRRRT